MFKCFQVIYQIFRYIREFVISLFFIISVLIAFSLITLFNSLDKPEKAHEFMSGALLLHLDGYLADNSEQYADFYRLLDDSEPQKISTFDVADVILSAKNDDRITGLVIDIGRLRGADLASLYYLGNWIARFKKTGKPVIAIGNAYSQSQYYLASFADEIYLNPAGFVELKGLNYSNLYFKSLLDKLEAVPHIFRVGTYKSAVEPFIRDDMSPEARQNATLLVKQLWHNVERQIAENRNIKTEQVLPEAAQYLTLFKQAHADEAQYALNQKFATQLATKAEIDTILSKKFGSDGNHGFKRIDYEDYMLELNDRFEDIQEPKIAVVNVEGEIVLGEGDGSSAGSSNIIAALHKVKDDPNVEGLILRVNSPGGSAMASELIRQEVSHIQQLGKPVVASMGGMAASGGYWISATSDKIVASPQTITGSIGIFGLSVSFDKTAKKIGVSEDGISTSFLAEESALKPLNADQAKALQMSIEAGYDKFLNLVSQGRKMSKAEVDKIAQGQVWTGEKAKELGLVDELGDFETAFNLLSELVDHKRSEMGKNVQNYQVQWYSDEESSSLKSMLSGFKLKLQAMLSSQLNLPLLATVKQPTDLLAKFNDPKNTYLYCLTCGKVE